MALNLKRKRGATAGATSKKRQLSLKDDISNAQRDDKSMEEASEDLSEGEYMRDDTLVSEGDAHELEVDGNTEEWAGFGENGAASVPPHRLQTNAAKKPPTGDEVRAIKEAADLFRSSSFKLQIDALLPNVRPKESRRAALDHFLLSVHTALCSAPPVHPQNPHDAEKSLLSSTSNHIPKQTKGKRKATSNSSPLPSIATPYPFPPPPQDANWKVAFEKPSEITLVGSWPNKVSVKSKDDEPWIVDIAVEMPSSLFQEKDYMNGRFFHKRAFYIAALAKHLTSPESGIDLEASYHSHGFDPRLTTLLLRPLNDEKLAKFNAQVRITPHLSSQSPIPLSKLSPRRSNFRVGETSTAVDPTQQASNLPTPIYNSVLMLATTPREHLLAVHSMKQDLPAYGDALALLRIWANQRGYGEGTAPCVQSFDGRGAWWNSLLEALVLGEEPIGASKTYHRPLGKGLSSYQLFRAALDFLARQDLAQNAVFVKAKAGHRFPSEEYAAQDGPVFVDSISVNLLAGIPQSSVGLLRHDARVTLDALNSADASRDLFHETFLKDHRSLATRFDAVVSVNLTGAKMRKVSAHSAIEYGSPSNALLASISVYIQRALGPRVRAFAILHPSPRIRPITQAQPEALREVYIGLVYDPEHAWRLVDHGPNANESETLELGGFRELWGDKAELRRFKDGSIVESVVWDVKNADERARIPLMIVEHVLARHFSIPHSALHSWQSGLDDIIRLPQSIVAMHTSAGHQVGFKAAMTAFDDLVKTLKGLDKDLPLSILSVSPSSAYLRSTSVFNPIAMPSSAVSSFPACARFTPIMDLILEFERSGRWPDDLRAIQKMKLAFFERLASALMSAVPGLTAQIAVAETPRDTVIEDHARLELITPAGWVFALRIWHAREETLLTRAIDAVAQIPKQFRKDHAEKIHERDAALLALDLYTRRFIHGPRHHRAVAALGHRYPAYPGTVRLVKRWLASHWLLRTHISEEAVEVLCAAVFTQASGGRGVHDSTEGIPASRERGFACIVELLKDWSWDRGMFVPVYAEDGVQPAVTIVAGTTGAWTLSTEFDKGGKMWTTDGPDIVAAQRVRALARATWECMKGAEAGSLDAKSLFIHPTDDYDFVVPMEPAALPRYYQSVAADPGVWARKGRYANMAQEASEMKITVRPSFDPAQMYIDDLKAVYADTLKIFYDPLGGDRFGVVWEPSVRQPRPFRVLSHFSSVPMTQKEGERSKERAMVVVNEAAVLDEIVRMGQGLIRL